MRRSYLYCLLAVVLAVFSACSDEDNASGGKKPGTDGFFALDAASLKDWDYGLSDGQCCLVFKADSAGDVLACAVDKDSGSKYEFFAEFNDEGKLSGLGMSDEYYDSVESDDAYTLFKWNDNGELESTTISKAATKFKGVSGEESVSKDSRIGASGQPAFANVAGEMFGIYEALKNAGMLNSDWQEGRWSDFFNNLGNIITGEILGKLKSGGLPGIVISLRVSMVKEEINYRNTHWLYGSSEIMITDISKLPDDTYLVTTEISGISSIPSTAPINYIDAATLRPYATVERENHVYAGVLCRKNYPAFINYYDYKSEEEDISHIGGENAIVQFVLPALGKGTYYVKPYLRSSINEVLDTPPGESMASKPYTRVLPGEFATTGTRYIKYGSDMEINNLGGKITDFSQVDASYTATDNTVKFVAYVSAEIDDNDDLDEWGVYYEYYLNGVKDVQYKRFPADMSTSKVKDEIRVEFIVGRNEFDYIDYTNFIASKNMNFGVYKKLKNPTGNLDYLTYSYGDMSGFTVTYDKKPTVEVYDAYVTGERPYDGDVSGLEKWCDYSFKAKADGCLFITCLSQKYGSEWATPNENYPVLPDEGDFMSDRVEYNFSSTYGYAPDKTSGATAYICIWLWSYTGQYEKLDTPYSIYCYNGSVSIITNTNTAYTKGTTLRPFNSLPVAGKPQRTISQQGVNR